MRDQGIEQSIVWHVGEVYRSSSFGTIRFKRRGLSVKTSNNIVASGMPDHLDSVLVGYEYIGFAPNFGIT